jgi:hypothetical protein
VKRLRRRLDDNVASPKYTFPQCRVGYRTGRPDAPAEGRRSSPGTIWSRLTGSAGMPTGYGPAKNYRRHFAIQQLARSSGCAA